MAVFINFHGLNMVMMRELRKLMRQSEAVYFVAKKTLIRKSMEDFKFGDKMPELGGEVGVVFGQGDAVASVKTIFKFRKSHPELSVLGGVLDKIFVGGLEMEKISKLPSREMLTAQFINVINAPARQMVGVLRAPLRDFISVLKQIKNN